MKKKKTDSTQVKLSDKSGNLGQFLNMLQEMKMVMWAVMSVVPSLSDVCGYGQLFIKEATLRFSSRLN